MERRKDVTASNYFFDHHFKFMFFLSRDELRLVRRILREFLACFGEWKF